MIAGYNPKSNKNRFVFVMLLILVMLLVGCHRVVQEQPESITIYATFYPIYALADAVMYDIPDATLHCLVQPQDGCLRDYSLSDWDAYILAGADAVIAGGRGLESFESLLMSIGDDGPAVSAVLYNLELHNQDHTHEIDDNESHLDGPNPHLYMSIEGARQIVDSISAVMMSMDPVYASQYSKNAQAAKARLQSLSDQIHVFTADLEGRSVVLMNETLIYIAEDYGLEVALRYDRESGFGLYDAGLAECLEQLEECGATVILIEQQAPQELVDALIAAGYSVALIDIMSTHSETNGFDTYLQAQLNNAEAVRAAFDEAGL